ncbi:MAG: glutathione S-transferase family protein [Planctomycetota bacterium]|jgi:glutathione S-transferase
MLRLYNSEPSGNCYKVRLLLAHLAIPYETIEVDVVSGARPQGLAEGNPLNRVPMLVLDDGRCLPESNAILWHLAQGTDYLPQDPDQVTQLLRWMFFEQNVHESSIAVNRFLISLLKKPDRFAEAIAFNHRRGVAALEAMEQHLRREPFFVGERYSIADIALYGYTHVADEGGFDLEPYPAIDAWLGRVRMQPGHVSMLAADAG